MNRFDLIWPIVAAVLCGIVVRSTLAHGQNPLFCGDSVTYSLTAGAVDSLSLETADPAVGHVEVTDASGGIGGIRLAVSNPAAESCDGGLTVDVPSTVEVSDCEGQDAGDYTIAYNIVSDSPENCGPILTNQPPVTAALTLAGQVDSYRFLFSTGDAKVLSPTVSSGMPADVRIRVFDSAGHPVDVGDDCGEVRFEGVGTGFFTALVSACSGTDTFEYVLTEKLVTAPELLTCGQTLRRSLVPRDTDTFDALVSFGGVGLVDLADISGSIGQFRVAPQGIGQSFCTYSRRFQDDAHLRIRSCDDQGRGDYAISLNVVSDTVDNCGTPLKCDESPGSQMIEVAGETDSFALLGSPGDVVGLVASGAEVGSVRLRFYDPQGNLLTDTCDERLDATLTVNGVHTVLASACDGTSRGSYTLEWTAMTSCSPGTAVGEFAYIALETPAIGIVDLGTNRLSSAVLVNANPSDIGWAQLSRTASAGFVYAYFDLTPSILSINSTTKELVFEIPFGALGFAVDPGGAFLYVPRGDAIVIIDTAQRRFAGSIPLEQASGDELVVVSPDGTRLYVLRGGFSSQQIAVVDLVTRSQITSIVDERLSRVSDMEISPDGRVLYAVTSQAIVVVNALENTVETTIPDARDIYAVAFSPVAPRAFMLVNSPTFPSASSLVAIDTTTHMSTGSTDLPLKESTHIAVSPGGSRAVILARNRGSELDYEVVIYALETNHVVTRIPIDAEPFDVLTVRPPEGLCTGDRQLQTKVTIGELTSSVNFALDGCPGSPESP